MIASGWLAFGRDLLGTFIGAAVGFALAMWWDRRKAEADRTERRIRTLESIGAELDRAKSAIAVPALSTAPGDDGAVEVDLAVPLLAAYAFDAAVDSGNLTLLSADLQARLSACYEQMRVARLLADSVTTFATQALDVNREVQFLHNTILHLQAHLSMLSGAIEEIGRMIETERHSAENLSP